MPIYEYACTKCEHEFEVEQRITEGPVKTCPKCRSRKVKRLISRTSFMLKGSGWYSDLYSSKGPDKDEKKEPAAGDDSKKSETPEKSDKTEKSEKPDSGGDGKDKGAGKKGKKSSPKAAA